MASIAPLLLTVIFLIGSFFLTAINSAFRSLRHQQAKEAITEIGDWFFYVRFQQLFFPSTRFKLLFFASICAASLTRFGFAAASIFFLYTSQVHVTLSAMTFSVAGFLLVAMVIGEIVPRVWGARFPVAAIRFSAFIASFFLIACFPISYIFLWLSLSWWRKVSIETPSDNGAEVRARIFEIIHDSNISEDMDPEHRRLIESAITFRDRIVREVMVPRVDVLSFSVETTIREASHRMAEEGFSRAPVFRGNLDTIVGIVLYKELLRVYMNCRDSGDNEGLDAPIESILTEVLYTPETRKISHMLQEFRRRQLHLAVVVDEYGGTEGVVTMEDLLEEIVGEIEDEYDTEEELYIRHADGSLVIDARMSILDIQQKLSIGIPQDPDYDTLAGYIFHRAGMIPSKGMVIHHDDFDLEIISSDDRRVHKVRLTPLIDRDDI